MAAFNKFQQFVEDALSGYHDFTDVTVRLALSNTAPNAATNEVLADITQIADGGGYTAGGYALSTLTLSRASGVAKVDAADLTIEATGASIGPFQYLVLYAVADFSGEMPAGPVNPLIAWYDYGSALTLADGESLTVDFDDANGIFTLT